jgi:hypothetical protein
VANPRLPYRLPGVGRPYGVFGAFTYYLSVMLFLNLICQIMKFAFLELTHKAQMHVKESI